jgi:hypothetical protein
MATLNAARVNAGFGILSAEDFSLWRTISEKDPSSDPSSISYLDATEKNLLKKIK